MSHKLLGLQPVNTSHIGICTAVSVQTVMGFVTHDVLRENMLTLGGILPGALREDKEVGVRVCRASLTGIRKYL